VTDDELLDELAVNLLRPLVGVQPRVLRTFAAGLELSDELRYLGAAINYLSRETERGEAIGTLSRLEARVFLKDAVHSGLLARLATSEERFWVGVCDALTLYAAQIHPPD
jgi:hypothetical protein